MGDTDPGFLDEHRFTEPSVAQGTQLLRRGPQHSSQVEINQSDAYQSLMNLA